MGSVRYPEANLLSGCPLKLGYKYFVCLNANKCKFNKKQFLRKNDNVLLIKPPINLDVVYS